MPKSIGNEIVRKVLHVILAVFFIILAEILGVDAVIYFAFLIFILFTMVRFLGMYSFLKVNTRVSFGEFFFIFGIVFASVISLSNIKLFELGMIVLAVADPVAAIFGMYLGKHEYFVFGEMRTFEGSFFCALASFLIFVVFGVLPLFSAVSAIVIMLVEALSPRGSDNLFLPTISIVLFKLFV